MKNVEIGPFEVQGLSGVAIARGAEAIGIRLAFPHPSIGLFDDKDILMTLDRMGPHASELDFVEYSWRVPVTERGLREFAGKPRLTTNSPVVYRFGAGDAATVAIQWRKAGRAAAQGRYSSDIPIKAALIVNGCFKDAVVEEVAGDFCCLRQRSLALELRLSGRIGRPFTADTRLQIEQICFGITQIPKGSAMAVYPVELGPSSPLHFQLSLREPGLDSTDLIDAYAIDKALAAGKSRLGRSCMRSTGRCAGAAEAVSALAGYGRCYDPKRRRIHTTVNRTWSGPNRPGLVFGWDNFFTSYAASWDDPALGSQSLEHIVGVYGEKGIAKGPTQRNLVIPLLYRKTIELLGNRSLAFRTWPTMMEFMRFWFADRGDGVAWRDGNGDGLLECGASRDPLLTNPGVLIQDAMDETGYDEIPIYSAGFTDGRRGLLADGVAFDIKSLCLTINLVCQNSLYIASCRAMADTAELLGKSEDASWLRSEAERVAERMQKILYNRREGIFMDRFWSGTFSKVKAMTIFFPLIAGIADEKTKDRLRDILLDPNQFWGDNLVPTVSRDDPAYCDGVDRKGNYWRGNCWPPATYMVWMAAKEAGWDDVSAMLADKVNRQFMRYWRRHGHAYENYPAEGSVDHDAIYPANWGGRELRYVWAAMLPLCALEEIFGPETLCRGVRFGNPKLEYQSAWKNFRYANRNVKATAGPDETSVAVEKSWTFTTKPGTSVRRFVQTRDGISFCLPEVDAGSEIAITHEGISPQTHFRFEPGAQGIKIEPAAGSARLKFHQKLRNVNASCRFSN